MPRLAAWALTWLLVLGTLLAPPCLACEVQGKAPTEKSESDTDGEAKEWNLTRRQLESTGKTTRSFAPEARPTNLSASQAAFAARLHSHSSSGKLLAGSEHCQRNGIGAPLRT